MTHWTRSLLYLLFAFFLCNTSLVAQESAEERIKDIKGPGGYNITAFDRDSKTGFGGYFDTEIISKQTSSGREVNFRAHRLVLEASARLNPKILFNSEIEFEYGANTDNHGELKIEQAWVDFEINESFIQRTGIVVIPFGRQNILHDSDVRDLTSKGIYSYYIVPSTWYDTGLGAHGLCLNMCRLGKELSDSFCFVEVFFINGGRFFCFRFFSKYR